MDKFLNEYNQETLALLTIKQNNILFANNTYFKRSENVIAIVQIKEIDVCMKAAVNRLAHIS
jgi:hypothetical protein